MTLFTSAPSERTLAKVILKLITGMAVWLPVVFSDVLDPQDGEGEDEYREVATLIMVACVVITATVLLLLPLWWPDSSAWIYLGVTAAIYLAFGLGYLRYEASWNRRFGPYAGH